MSVQDASRLFGGSRFSTESHEAEEHLKMTRSAPFALDEYRRTQLRAERWRLARAVVHYYLLVQIGLIAAGLVFSVGLKVGAVVELSGLLWLVFGLHVRSVEWRVSDLRTHTPTLLFAVEGGEERELPAEVAAYVIKAKKAQPGPSDFKAHWVGNDPYIVQYRDAHAPKLIVAYDVDDNGGVHIKYPLRSLS